MLKKCVLSIVLSMSMVLTGCTAVLIGGAAAGGYMVGKDERSASTVASDASITTAVKTKLLANKYVNGFKIDVDTYSSVVTLTGKVNSKFSQEQAIKIASETRGVSNVVNKLTVDTGVQPES